MTYSLAFLRDVLIISELARLEESRYQEAQQALAEEARRNKIAEAAAAHQRLLKILTGSHRIKLKRVDWQSIANEPIPGDAVNYTTNEKEALQSLEEYRPSLWALLSGGAKRRRSELEALVTDARTKDRISQKRVQQLVEDRRRKLNLARDVLSFKPESFAVAFSQWAELKDVGVEKVHIKKTDMQTIVLIDAMELDDMPSFNFHVDNNGELVRYDVKSEEKIKIYREHICSSAIRVASEALCALPVSQIEVIVQADLLNRATGYTETEVILQMSVSLAALVAVNLEMADPVPLAIHLGAQFDWDAQEGFQPLNMS